MWGNSMIKIHNKQAFMVLIGYFLFIGYMMLFGFGRSPHETYMYNLVPFSTIQHFMQLSNFNTNIWVINLIGNIGVFIPFGLLIPMVFGERYVRFLFIFLLGLFILETLQLITRRGSFDIDDFILNTIGATIGYSIYYLACFALKNSSLRRFLTK